MSSSPVAAPLNAAAASAAGEGAGAGVDAVSASSTPRNFPSLVQRAPPR